MGAIVFASIFGLIAVGMVVGSRLMPKKVTVAYGRYGDSSKEVRNWARTGIAIGAVIPLLIGGVIFGFAGFHTVPVKNVGVVTQYGKVVGQPYGPGGHWLFPTKSLNNIPLTIQSDTFAQANGQNADQYTSSGASGYCITIRLGMQNEGCADVQLQTETNPSAVPYLYANYSSYGPNLAQDVDKYVVKRDLTTVLNRDLGDYNVIEDITQQLQACDLHNVSTCNVNAQSQFSKFDPQLAKDLQAALGTQVTVKDVNLQYIHYDSNTEQAIQKITTSYLETAQAVQQQQTNSALSQAAANLQNNKAALTPNYLQYLCYQTTQDAEKANYSLPATWNCSGGSSAGVLVNGK